MFKSIAVAAVGSVCLIPQAFAQSSAKVDFAHDVQPIFRQNCIGCHGPNKQNNGLRVDRRSSVLKPGTRRVIPGSLENSLLYYRLVGNDFGMQMPPTGPLRPEQVRIIKSWIEQGAEWPDALANEVDLPPINPKAVAMVDALRNADRQTFNKMMAEDPKLLNSRGPEGSTPLMYAVLYTDAAMLERLIKAGADPNKRNDVGATALMWAALDLEKTRVLLSHGADVNAKSDDARTPLMIAAGKPGNIAVVRLLLSHDANPNPTANPSAESSPLAEAALAGDPEIIQALLEKGAAVKDVAGGAIADAAGAGCKKCIDILVARNLDAQEYTVALGQVAVLNDAALIKMMLDHGADVNAADPTGRTPLMYAAVSDAMPVEPIKLLLEKKADINAKSQHPKSGDTGRTPLDLARMHGNTAVVDLLMKSGALSGVADSMQPAPVRTGNTIQAAVSSSLPILQRTDASFVPKAGCVSCHNNSLEAMAVAQARKSGFHVDDQLSARQVQVNAGSLMGIRDMLHQGYFITGINANPFILGYILLGLDAEGYKSDMSTDAVAMYLLNHQMADGHWAFGPEARPPLCASGLSQTVIAMRALQLYTPRVDKAAYAKSIQSALAWIAEFKPRTNYDMAWRLQALAWGSKSKDGVLKARADLLAVQRADGGWSDLASMESSAFTTGLAMLALQNSGLPVTDAAYQRGVQYLLGSQLPDGSWHVRTRAAGFQPYFDNGYPHGVDQWISAAGSSLATLALTLAAPPPKSGTAAAGEQ